jgi:hypothetical protein
MEYLEKRDLENLDANLRNIFTLTTLRCSDPGEECSISPLGSFSVRAQPYYSDIDVDDVYIGSTLRETQKNVTRYLKEIVKHVLASERSLIFYSDFKAGGLHWTSQDVIRGRVRKPEGGYLLLQDAILMDSPVKLDVIFYYGTRFIEESVFYKIYLQENGAPVSVNVKAGNIVGDIAKDGLHYAEDGNLLKAAKRAFSIAKFTKDPEALAVFGPIVTSSIQILGQIMSDISTINLLIEKGYGPHIQQELFDEIQHFKERTANIMDFYVNPAIFDQPLPEMYSDLSELANQRTVVALGGFSVEDYLSQFVD